MIYFFPIYIWTFLSFFYYLDFYIWPFISLVKSNLRILNQLTTYIIYILVSTQQCTVESMYLGKNQHNSSKLLDREIIGLAKTSNTTATKNKPFVSVHSIEKKDEIKQYWRAFGPMPMLKINCKNIISW